MPVKQFGGHAVALAAGGRGQVRKIRQGRCLEKNDIMNPLMVSKMAILMSPQLKRDHDALNGIINGYYGRTGDGRKWGRAAYCDLFY